MSMKEIPLHVAVLIKIDLCFD